MGKRSIVRPDTTAIRVALWRSLHVQLDPPPHLLSDEIGLRLAAPKEGWRNRPDMKGPAVTRYRAGVVIRARFVEDLVTEQLQYGLQQYVILGAGLDTFAQRRQEIASRLQIFEVDQPGPQIWKRERLIELGYPIPAWLHFVPVDFEANDIWIDNLIAAGFDLTRPALVACTGVSMYLSKDAIASTFLQVAKLAPGSTFAMTFLLPQNPPQSPARCNGQMPNTKARRSRMPFISFFTPPEILSLAREAGFREARHISGTTLTARYFSDRIDTLPPSSAEEMLVAVT